MYKITKVLMSHDSHPLEAVGYWTHKGYPIGFSMVAIDETFDQEIIYRMFTSKMDDSGNRVSWAIDSLYLDDFEFDEESNA